MAIRFIKTNTINPYEATIEIKGRRIKQKAFPTREQAEAWHNESKKLLLADPEFLKKILEKPVPKYRTYKAHKPCKHDGCDKPNWVRGYCSEHVKLLIPVDEQDKCKLEYCDKVHTQKGYCEYHYGQFRAGNGFTPYNHSNSEPKICSFVDCGRKAIAHGLCAGHVGQKRRGLTLSILDTKKPCKVPGCNTLAKKYDYCHLHYYQSPDFAKVRKTKYKPREKLRQKDPKRKAMAAVRRRFKNVLKINCLSGRTIEYLGCSMIELKKHLEDQFWPGMTWDNYGFGRENWNIDHINPLSSYDFTKQSELLKCFHYTNLQPLWFCLNMEKSDKTDWIPPDKATYVPKKKDEFYTKV